MADTDDTLRNAAAAGFPVLDTAAASALQVDRAAARMLPPDDHTVAIAFAGEVLRVVTSRMPSPATLRQLEQDAGTLVTVEVADPTTVAQLRSQLTGTDGAPWSVSPALEAAIELGASDLHLGVGIPPIVRVNGALRALANWPPLSADDLAAAARWVAGDLDDFDGDRDRAVTFLSRRWRVSLYQQRNALAMALRLLPTTPPAATELRLPAAVVNLADLHAGLVLVCGKTGAGKSTTMAALIDRINRERPGHILTIEDPIEYLHPNRRSMVHQREVGIDTADFATGLRAALRQDPDVILVGELRDLETMRTALAAAETGHLVLATVHANSTASAVTRMVTSFPAGEQDQVRVQLAASLQAAIYQTLLPSTRGGRVLAAEVLLATSAVRSIIREDKLHSLGSVLESQVGAGMTSLDRTLAQLVSAGLVTAEDAAQHTIDTSAYEQHLTRSPTHELGILDPLADELDTAAPPASTGPRGGY